MQENTYSSIARLAALVNILSFSFEDQAWFIEQLNYPANQESAQRAFRRDLAALRALGFQIEEERRSNKPAYRLVGHAKWPRAAAVEQAFRPTGPHGSIRNG